MNAPTTATSGTLNTDELQTLTRNKGAYLLFNNEVYRLQDSEHESGYLVYSHIGYNNTAATYKIKCITITVNTGGWVLTEREVSNSDQLGTKLYKHIVTADNGQTHLIVSTRSSEYTSFITITREIMAGAIINYFIRPSSGIVYLPCGYNNYNPMTGQLDWYYIDLSVSLTSPALDKVELRRTITITSDQVTPL